METSTLYDADAIGCIEQMLTTPTADDKLETQLSWVAMIGPNPFENGKIRVRPMKLQYDTNGALRREYLWSAFALDYQTIIETDYTTYAIVYQCSYRYGKILNFNVDDVHILSRTGTMDTSTLDSHKATAEGLIPGLTGRWETLKQSDC